VASETFDTLAALVSELCAVERKLVKPESNLMGFGLDSVRLLDLILAIEDRFGLTINESDPELAGVQTVADLVALVDRRRGGAR
jgi:acyl carrier protein